MAGEIAQHDLWFPPVELPVGFGQARTAAQLPVLTMVTGYARWLSAVLIPSRRAEDLYAGWWALLAGLGAVPRVLVWAGEGGEGAKYWLQVLTEIKNRGVDDVCIVVCDGLPGLPAAINTVWPQTLVQACILHLIRNTFRYTSRRYFRADGQGPAPGLHRGDRGRRRRAVLESSSSSGGISTRRSSRCGTTRGRSSCRSWTTT